jgi:hypothetical protein
MKAEGTITVRTFCTAAAAVLALVALFWSAYPPRYLTNDDVVIRLGLEGKAFPGQRATGFVLMTHSALGWSLVWLRRLIPAAPVWDMTVAVTLVCAIAVLLGLTWSALGNRLLDRLVAGCALFVGILPLITNMQFTMGPTLAGGAAVLIVMTELARTQPRRTVVTVAAVLFIAALLVRAMGATAGALIVALFMLPWAVWHARIRGRRLVSIAAVPVMVAAISTGVVYLDGQLYRVADPAWDTYNRYNWMAAQLVEWGGDLPADDIATIRAAAGWSTNDWAMLQRWLAVDPAVHGYEQVSRAYEARGTSMPWSEWLIWMAQRTASISGDTIQHVAIESAFPWIAIATVAGMYARWRGWVAVVLGILVFVGFCVAIEARFKDLPFRLLAPLMGSITAAVIVIAGTRHRQPRAVAAIAGLAIVLTVLTYEARAMLDAAARDRTHTAQVEREVQELMRLSPALVVIQADAFPSEHWWRPFVRPEVNVPAIALATINPQLQEFLTSTGRQPVFKAICDDPSIVVVSEKDRLDLVTTYFKEHFNRAVDWTQVYSGSFRAWRCVG